MNREGDDYVLGTDEAELARLGLQHAVWRERALAAWRRAGFGPGMRVVDVGAGPGYAACDLAGCVRPGGRVVAVERNAGFAHAARERALALGLDDDVEVVHADLSAPQDPLAAHGPFDAAWCRWVASFVPSRADLVERIAGALAAGGVAVFHEYVDYAAWRLVPRSDAFERFVAAVMRSWREWGGEPDAALELVERLPAAGLRIESMRPLAWATRPGEGPWRWPVAFVESGLRRLVEIGAVDEAFAGEVRDAVREAEANADAVMITPTVLEIVARRPGARATPRRSKPE